MALMRPGRFALDYLAFPLFAGRAPKGNTMNDDDLLQLVEDTANMLRGMTMDPAIPEHAKDAMRARVVKLESAVTEYLNADA